MNKVDNFFYMKDDYSKNLKYKTCSSYFTLVLFTRQSNVGSIVALMTSLSMHNVKRDKSERKQIEFVYIFINCIHMVV